jgi:hypothetical protein
MKTSSIIKKSTIAILIAVSIFGCSSTDNELKLIQAIDPDGGGGGGVGTVQSPISNLGGARVPSNLPDGLFFATGPAPYGKAYFVLEGQARHIQSILTLDGLFTNVNIQADAYAYNAYTRYLEIHPEKIGNPLGPDNGLVHHTPTGRIYFREGNVIRYIPSMDVFNKYHFNMSALTNVISLHSYLVGDDVR